MENKWIAQSYIFADLLLKEILDQRCDPDGGFYLPGLAVANNELLQVLTPYLPDAHASEELQSGWNELLRTMMSDDVCADRFLKQFLPPACKSCGGCTGWTGSGCLLLCWRLFTGVIQNTRKRLPYYRKIARAEVWIFLL